MDCFGIPVLCVLNQEHHQERHDSRRSVDLELRGIIKEEYRPCRSPENNQSDRNSERPVSPHAFSRHAGNPAEPFFYPARFFVSHALIYSAPGSFPTLIPLSGQSRGLKT